MSKLYERCVRAGQEGITDLLPDPDSLYLNFYQALCDTDRGSTELDRYIMRHLLKSQIDDPKALNGSSGPFGTRGSTQSPDFSNAIQQRFAPVYRWFFRQRAHTYKLRTHDVFYGLVHALNSTTWLIEMILNELQPTKKALQDALLYCPEEEPQSRIANIAHEWYHNGQYRTNETPLFSYFHNVWPGAYIVQLILRHRPWTDQKRAAWIYMGTDDYGPGIMHPADVFSVGMGTMHDGDEFYINEPYDAPKYTRLDKTKAMLRQLYDDYSDRGLHPPVYGGDSLQGLGGNRRMLEYIFWRDEPDQLQTWLDAGEEIEYPDLLQAVRQGAHQSVLFLFDRFELTDDRRAEIYDQFCTGVSRNGLNDRRRQTFQVLNDFDCLSIDEDVFERFMTVTRREKLGSEQTIPAMIGVLAGVMNEDPQIAYDPEYAGRASTADVYHDLIRKGVYPTQEQLRELNQRVEWLDDLIEMMPGRKRKAAETYLRTSQV